MIDLPNKPSELIRLALIDLHRAENTPGYIVKMYTWHEQDAELGRCVVCLAGSVMAMRLGSDINETVWPDSFGVETGNKLAALDSFRKGRVREGFEDMDIEWEWDNSNIPAVFPVEKYEYDPKLFKRDMNELANMLEREGY